MLSGEIKKELINVLVPFINKHREAREKVTPEVVKQFMTPRSLKFSGAKK